MTLFELAFLALKGLLVAAVPLAFVWVAKGNQTRDDAAKDAGPGAAAALISGGRFRRLAWVTVFFTFDLLVFGGFTRLTDSGLGCPDWPGCYAKANPLAASGQIGAAQAAMPTGPVTMTKAWIEMIHRYLAMAVGVLIIVMLAVAWRRYFHSRRADPRQLRAALSASAGVPSAPAADRPWLATALLALVCLQGAFGAWTVTMKLQPVIVTTHLLLAMLLLVLLVWHASSLDRPAENLAAGIRPSPALRRVAIAGIAALSVQIALGGWVSTNYAVLACGDFPLCHGQVVPDMDLAQGFHLWRELGRTADGAYLPFAALTAIHWIHRSFAYIVFAILAALAWRARLVPQLRGLGKALALLLAAQFTTGVVNVVMAWPLAAAVLHNAGAAGLVVVLVLINYRIHRFYSALRHSAEPFRTPDTAHATGT